MSESEERKMLRRVCSILIDGLTTDGAHHKQYFMEQALKEIAPDEFKETKKSWVWDDGIPA